MTITAIAPWYGSNRLLAKHVGAELAGCIWVGVPFAGGMCELIHITARTLHVNDSHKLVVNLARTIADPDLRKELARRLRNAAFRPDELNHAQEWAKVHPLSLSTEVNLDAAYFYFVCC